MLKLDKKRWYSEATYTLDEEIVSLLENNHFQQLRLNIDPHLYIVNGDWENC